MRLITEEIMNAYETNMMYYNKKLTEVYLTDNEIEMLKKEAGLIGGELATFYGIKIKRIGENVC